MPAKNQVELSTCEPPELIKFCQSCSFEDCTAMNGCAEYKKYKRALKEGKPYSPPAGWGGKQAEPKPPAIELKELPTSVQNIQLHKYNEAIRALEELRPHATNMDAEIISMLGALKGDRSAKYDHLVDWDAIARGGRK